MTIWKLTNTHHRLALLAAVMASGLFFAPAIAQDTSSEQPAPAQPTQQTPLVDEGFDDWRVVCSARAEGGRICSMLQQLVNQQGVRVMAIELKPNGDRMAGTLIMPFGLDLPAGVRLKVDKTEPTKAIPYSTCLYDGCVVELALNETTTTAIRAGNQMLVLARSNDDQDLELTVSLRGASKAADRVAELAAQ